MAVAGSSVQPVDRKGKKPFIEQASHIVFPPELYGQPRRYITTSTARTKVASQFSPTRFHRASITAGTSAWPILGNDSIDSGVSDLDFEPTRNRRGSYWKNLTAKTEVGKVVLCVSGNMRLVDGYKLVGQELGGLLDPRGMVAGDSEARLLEENMMKENIAQLRQEIKDTRKDKEALQREMTELEQCGTSAAASFQQQKDECKRLNTRNQEVTRQRDEAETKNIDLADSLRKAKAEKESSTKQYSEEVQRLEEEIGKLQTSLQERVSTLEGQVQLVQADKTALEHEKTSLQERVDTLEEQIDLIHNILNIILDQSSLDYDLRGEEIGSLRSNNDRWREQIEELEEGICVLYVAYAESETGLEHFRALSEHLQRSSMPIHQQNEVRRLQARPSEIDLTMVRKKGGKFGVMAKDGEVKWLKRRKSQ